MAATDYPPIPFTETEYLALEAVAEIKHEFFDGQIIAMAGAEPEHNQIAHNLHVVMGNALADRPCRIVGPDQRLLVEATRGYFYPDLVVICAEPVFVDPKPRSLINPEIVFEVLSPTTELKDRSAKWVAYRTIPTLTDYVMVASTRREIEHHHRSRDGVWRSVIVQGGQIELMNGVALDLGRIYRLSDLT